MRGWIAVLLLTVFSIALGAFIVFIHTRITNRREQNEISRASGLHERLASLGFYKHCDISRAKAVLADLGISAWFEATKRGYYVDAESLTEGGALNVLRDIEPFLNGEGVRLSNISEAFNPEDPEAGYSLSWDGKTFEIYSASGTGKFDLWRLAVDNTIRAINEILEIHETKERAYFLNSYELLVFLTPEMHTELKSAKVL